MSSIPEVMLRRANDDIGDNRFIQVSNTLSDITFLDIEYLNVGTDEELSMVITNAKLIAEDGDKPSQVLATCVQTIMDACSLWSPIRLSEQQAAVVVALQRVHKVALAVDVVYMALLTRHTKAFFSHTAQVFVCQNNCCCDPLQDLPFRQNTKDFLTLMQDAESE